MTIAGILFFLAITLQANAEQAEDAGPFQPAFTFSQLAVENCKAWCDQLSEKVDPRVLQNVLGFVPRRDQESAYWNWIGPGGEKKETEQPTYHFLLAFTEPVLIGTILCPSLHISFLRPEATYPPDPARTEEWQPAHAWPRQSGIQSFVLPPGLRTRALLCSFPRHAGQWPASFPFWRCFRQRLLNVMPAANAVASEEYPVPTGIDFAPSPVSVLTTGHGPAWQNCGPDQEGMIRRPPIDAVSPVWITFSWADPQPLAGLYLDGDCGGFLLARYAGPEDVPPAAGTPREWKKIPAETLAGRFFQFPPILTRGFRLTITQGRPHDSPKSESIAILRGLHAYVDLRDQPLPAFLEPARERPCPLQISYDMPRQGPFAMVIDDAAGRRVRNLVACVTRPAGPNSEAWDAKDHDGKLAPPGDYTWKAVTSKPLELHYQFTVYPNVKNNPPWITSHTGPGGWLADHSPPVSACTAGDRIWLGSPVVEAGTSFIECDLSGRRIAGWHSVGPFQGPRFLAADGHTVFIGTTDENVDRVWGYDPQRRDVRLVLEQPSTEERATGLAGLAARDGLVYLAIRSGPCHPKFDYTAHTAEAAKTPRHVPPSNLWVTKPFGVPSVDLDHCLPRYSPARKKRHQDDVVADPRTDFVRLFRLAITPPGRSVGLVTLETSEEAGRRHHVVLALKAPQAIGSAVFPAPPIPENIRFYLSVLKPEATFPPNADDRSQWIVLEDTARSDWDVVPFPPGTQARAVRLTWERTDGDPLAEVAEGGASRGKKQDTLNLEDMGVQEDEEKSGPNWKGVLEGMTFLRRRFQNLMHSAAVRVNSGDLRENGEWHGAARKPLSSKSPGIYLIEWTKPVKVCGLALKEIDGQTTKIDVFTGGPGVPVNLEGQEHWKEVAAYEQPRRDYYSEAYEGYNAKARYLDGLVDFGEEVETRAVRLRIIQAFQTAEGSRLGVREDLGGTTLDPRRCRVFGVAPLGYLGGETPVDSRRSERIAVYDERKKTYLREIAIERPDALAFSPRGDLFALSGKRLVKVDQDAAEDASKHRAVVEDLELPQALAIDAQSRLYVFDASPDRQSLRVYSPEGQFFRSIGNPGGRVAGPYDPTRLQNVTALAIDQNERLWVVEQAWHPKRISQWTLDGRWLQDFLGPGEYGGGGVLDPVDKSRFYYKNFEFELDWDHGAARLKNILWLPLSQSLYMGGLAGDVPLYLNGRQYMVTRGDTGRQSVGVVHLYEKDHLKPVAALGAAAGFPYLKDPDLLDALGGPTLSKHCFLWSDHNGDGIPQAPEVTLKDRNFENVGLFRKDLSLMSGKIFFRVKEILPTGAPVWEEQDFASIGGLEAFGTQYYRLGDGNFFILGLHNGLITPGGDIRWKYKTTGVSVAGTPHAPPYFPGQVAGEFNDLCHPNTLDLLPEGDLGPFQIHSSNAGVWNLWTHDGILAGNLFQDIRIPRTPIWTMNEYHRGLRLDGHSLSAEHFNGYFCRTADGRYYVVAGFNHASILEVRGLETFKRLSGSITLTAQDVQKVQEWETEQARRRIAAQPCVYRLYKFRQKDYRDWDSIPSASFIVEMDPNGRPSAQAQFRMAYDDENLYLSYRVLGLGPLRNRAGDWRLLFKTGASIDLQLGTDPTAPRDRLGPEPGDIRLLITNPREKPLVVLYRPNVPGSPPQNAYEIVSPTGRTVMDEVRQLETCLITGQTSDSDYQLEAAVPLAQLGFQPDIGQRYRFDWGMLTTDKNGNACTGRLYWSNKATNVLADAPTEARLTPHLWGDLIVHGTAGRSLAELQDMTRIEAEGRGGPDDTEPETEFED